MTDPVSAHSARTAPPTEAEHRGRLEVREQVVRRIATHVASQAHGTVEHHTTVGKVTARGLPRAEATVQAGHVRATVHIATVWPAPLEEVAAGVCQQVTEQVESLTGLLVDAVDVTIDAILPAGSGQERRVQ